MNKICVDWDSKTDNNNGYIYGIEYQDQEGNVIDIDWFNTEDCKLADNSDAKITINTWNESAQTWKGQHYKIEENGNLTITNFTWNKSTKVWDRD